jgi:serine/threonine-protein kinase HipA
LINTAIHVPGERDTALELFKDNFMTEGYKFSSNYSRDDFFEFGKRIGIKQTRIIKIFEEMTTGEDEVMDLVNKSYLSDTLKTEYLDLVRKRRERLLYSYSEDKEK